MTTSHTSGPWTHEGQGDITGIENDLANGCVGKVDVACVYLRTVPGKTEANARRLVACWNACEGISTESLESGQPMMAVFQKEQSRADRAEVGRDELLAALKHIASHGNKMDFDAVAYARAAIAKAGGEV